MVTSEIIRPAPPLAWRLMYARSESPTVPPRSARLVPIGGITTRLASSMFLILRGDSRCSNAFNVLLPKGWTTVDFESRSVFQSIHHGKRECPRAGGTIQDRTGFSRGASVAARR